MFVFCTTLFSYFIFMQKLTVMETSPVTIDIFKQINDQISCFIKVDYVKMKVNKSTYNLPRKTYLIKACN